MYIAINTERTINCSVVGGPFNFWRVIFRNSTPERGFTIGELVPGVTIASEASALSALIVNTTDTSIIGLECNGGFSNEDVTTRINLTIYGMLISYRGIVKIIIIFLKYSMPILFAIHPI